jgi:hypothetical protein
MVGWVGISESELDVAIRRRFVDDILAWFSMLIPGIREDCEQGLLEYVGGIRLSGVVFNLLDLVCEHAFGGSVNIKTVLRVVVA